MWHIQNGTHLRYLTAHIYTTRHSPTTAHMQERVCATRTAQRCGCAAAIRHGGRRSRGGFFAYATHMFIWACRCAGWVFKRVSICWRLSCHAAAKYSPTCLHTRTHAPAHARTHTHAYTRIHTHARTHARTQSHSNGMALAGCATARRRRHTTSSVRVCPWRARHTSHRAHAFARMSMHARAHMHACT